MTVTVAFAVPAVAVTVIVPSCGVSPVPRVAVAAPLVPVVFCTALRAPALELKVTATPESALLLLSRASAVMVAEPDPAEGICGALVDSFSVATVGVVVVVEPVLELLPLEL